MIVIYDNTESTTLVIYFGKGFHLILYLRKVHTPDPFSQMFITM